MLTRILFLLWFFLTLAEAANAGPLIAAIGAVITGVQAAIAASPIFGMIFKTVIGLGMSLLQQALNRQKNKPSLVGTTLEIKMGDDQPMTFPVGSRAVAGRRKYIGSWGEDGKTPNAYLTDVIEVSNLPSNAGPLGISSLWVGQQKCGVLWDQPHPDGRGYPVQQFIHPNGKRFMWIKYYDGTQTSADPFLMAKFGGHPTRPYTGERIGRGCQYIILTTLIDNDLQLGGSPPDVLVEPHPTPMYDPRKDSTNGGYGNHRYGNWSTYEPTLNPMVITYNISRGIYYTPNEWVFGGQAIEPVQLPNSAWFAAMNECDRDNGSGVAQYRCGLEVQCDQDPTDVIEALRVACAGRISENGGIIKPLVGAPGAAVYSFDDSGVVVTEEQDFLPFPSLKSTHNGIAGTYPEPNQRWAMTDAPEQRNPDQEAADGNRWLPAAIRFDAVPFTEQVQHLMKTMAAEQRRFRVHMLTLPPSAWALEPNDVVAWTSERNGYNNKKFLITAISGSAGMLQHVTLLEINPTDFDPPTIYIPAPNGWIGPITVPSQPMTGWAVEPSTIKDAGGIDRRPAIKISCAQELEDVIGVWVQVRLKETGDVVFDSNSNPYAEPYSWIISGQWMLANKDYEARGRYLPQSNRPTDWSAWLTVKTPNVLIQAVDIFDGAIIQSKIADAAVTAAKIMDEAITNLKLADKAVSTAKIEVAAVTAEVLASGAVIASKLADGAVTARALAQGAVDATALASSIKAVEVVDTLPATDNAEGRQVFLTTDGKLYRYHNGAWTASTAAADVTGQIASDQIADNAVVANKIAANAITADKLAQGSINNTKLANGLAVVEIVDTLPTAGNFEGRQAYLNSDGKTYRYHNGAWTAAVPAVDLVGQLGSDQIADSAISLTKFANGLQPVQVVTTFPPNPTLGMVIYHRGSQRLMRWNGTAWLASVATTDLTGTITSVQISDNSISTPKLVAGAVTADTIAANAITADKVAANAITTGSIAAGAVKADQIAAGAVTASKITIADTTNYVLNPGFDGGSSDGWTFAAPSLVSVISRDVGPSPAGAPSPYVLQMTASTTLNLAYGNIPFPVQPGEIYYFEVYAIFGTTGTASLRIGINFLDVDNTVNAYTLSAVVSSGSPLNGVWTKYSGQITVPATVSGKLTGKAQFIAAIPPNGTGIFAIANARLRRAAGGELIVDGAITAGKVAAGAISADKITANAITSDKIAANAITTGTIAAGAITATQLAAQSVTAKSLVLTDTSNMADNGWQNGSLDGWSSNGLTNYAYSNAEGDASGWFARSTAAYDQFRSKQIAASPGEQYYLDVWVQNNTSAAGASLWMFCYDANGANTINLYVAGVTATANAWVRLKGQAVVPAGSVKIQMALYNAAQTTIAAPGIAWSKPVMRRANGAELIVDGAITAGKVAANAILAKNIVVQDFENLVPNGKFDDATSLATDYWALVGETGATVTMITDPANALAGKVYLRLAKPRIGSSIDATTSAFIPVTPNDTLQWETAYKLEIAASAGIFFRTLWYDGNQVALAGTPQYTDLVQNAAGTTAWTIANGKTVVPAAARYFKFQIINWTTNTTGKNLDVAGIAVRRANAARLIVDGGITATQIAAKAITVDKLLVTNTDNQIDQGFSAGSRLNWQIPNLGSYYLETGNSPVGGTWLAQCDGRDQMLVGPNLIKVSPGESYNLSVWFYNTDTANDAFMGMYIKDALGGSVGANWIAVGATATAKNVWTFMQANVTIPANVYTVQPMFGVSKTGTNGLACFWGKPNMRRAAGGELIVDGAITADKIAANAVTAGKIAANAITAGTIAAGAVSAAQIAAGAITADKLAAGSVSTQALAVGTGGNFLSNSDLSAGLTGWAYEWSNEFSSFSLGLRTDQYAPLPGSIEVRQLNGNQGVEYGVGQVDAYGNARYFAVKASGWYELSVYYFGHRCTGVRPYVGVFDASDNLLAWESWGVFPANQNADPQKNLGNYQRFWGKVQMRANAAKARVFFRMQGTQAGQGDSYLWLTRMYFGEANPNQTEPTPWSDGSVTVIAGGNIATNAVTADKIAANAITAGKIAAGAVTAGTIAAGAVTATTIAGGSITGDKIAANTIGANQIAAGAITAKTLVLTDFSNMVDNGWQGGNLDGWGIQNLQNFYLDQSNADSAGYVVQSLARDCCLSKAVAVSPGETYAFDVWVYNADANTANILTMNFSGAGAITYGFVAQTATKNGWVRLQGRYAVPSGCVKIAMLLQVDKTAGTGNSCYWSKPVMRRATSGELIVDGAITGNKIAANAITSGQIATGAITTDKLILGGITYDKIASGAVTAMSAGRLAELYVIGAGATVNLTVLGIWVDGDSRVMINAMTLGQYGLNGSGTGAQAIGCNIFRDSLAIFSQTYYLGVVQTVVSTSGGGSPNGSGQTTTQSTYTAGLVGVPALYDAPGPGYHTYTLQIYVPPGNNIGWKESNIVATAFKR